MTDQQITIGPSAVDDASAANQMDLSSTESSQRQYHRRRRSHAQHVRRKRIHRAQRLLLGLLPFVIFLVGLTLTASSAVQYLEQESALGLFLTSRDEAADVVLHGTGWEATAAVTEPTAAPTAETTAVSKALYNDDGQLIVPFFYIGDQFGVISIPSVDIQVKAYQGDREKEFRKGAGHYPGSLFPGQDGNILVAGHRTTYFRKFEYLKLGDLVYFQTTYGRFTYQVQAFKIIGGSDSSIGADTSQEQLTMYTCYPFTYIGNAPKRFVVICSLIEKQVTQ